MSYLRCDGTITEVSGGLPSCDTGWLIIPDSSVESIFQPITIADATEITAAILLCWGIAYGIRFLIRTLLDISPGRFG